MYMCIFSNSPQEVIFKKENQDAFKPGLSFAWGISQKNRHLSRDGLLVTWWLDILWDPRGKVIGALSSPPTEQGAHTLCCPPFRHSHLVCSWLTRPQLQCGRHISLGLCSPTIAVGCSFQELLLEGCDGWQPAARRHRSHRIQDPGGKFL